MEKFCDVILVTFFTDFLKFDFVISSLKNHNLAKSLNFRSPKSKVKGRSGRRAFSAWRFLKICY